MLQTSLFCPKIEIEHTVSDPDGLRPYQRERVEQVKDLLQVHRSSLMVMHTGSGKTRTASALARHWKGCVLWLAHRDFLCSQARQAIVNLTGEFCGLERAEWDSNGERIVVASVQTLKGKRLEKFHPNHFALIIVDETHHIVANSYRAILERFPSAKIVGITATPQRLDKKGLGTIFESACEPYGIEEGIENGSFVPIDCRSELIDDIDLSKVKIAQGDLAIGDLEEQIIKSAAPIAQLSVKHMESRPTLVFTPGISSAHAVAATLREMGKTAVSVDASTESTVRDKVLKDFREGTTQYIVNCAILTEGLDLPNASGIVMARPTKSEALYIQIAGRGGRPLPHVGLIETAEGRRKAIAESSKPNFRLLDVTGHPGRHSLVCAVDLLGGDHSEEVKDLIKKKVSDGESVADLSKALDDAERSLKQEEEENRKRIAQQAAMAEVRSRQSTFDPFVKLGFDEHLHGEEPANARELASSDDIEWLKKNHLPWKNATKGTYEKFRAQARKWAKEGKATWNMRKMLEKFGFPVDLSFGVAGQVCGHIKDSGYKPHFLTVQRIIDNGK